MSENHRYKTDIVRLAAELERIRQTSTDIVASTKDVTAGKYGLHSGLRFDDSPGGTAEATELRLNVKGYGSYPLTRWGGLQLAEKTGIPAVYYHKMLGEGMIDLTATNVNAWLSKQADKRLFRVADGKVRAILSDRYRTLDNYDLAIMAMDQAKKHNAIVEDSAITETKMYMRFVVPEYKEQVKAGDDVVPGLMVSNSEVGDGAFRVEPFVFRLVCSNGIVADQSLYKIHIGGRLQVGELVFRDETKKLQDQALWAQVRDVIDSTFDRTLLRQVVAKLRDSQNVPIEQPTEAVDVVVKDLSLGEKDKLNLIRYFAREGDTLFGLVNGITRLAQDANKYEERVATERYAGKILAAPVAVTAK